MAEREKFPTWEDVGAVLANGDCPSDCPHLLAYRNPDDADCKLLSTSTALGPYVCPMLREADDNI